MYTNEEINGFGSRVIRAIQSGNLEQYSNYCLSGPMDGRMNLNGVALFFPEVRDGCPRYLLLVMDQS